MLPRPLRSGDIPGTILCVPGKAGTHLVERHIRQMIFHKGFFAGGLRAFDELNNAHPLAVAQCANHHAKSRAGFTFAITRQQHADPLLNIGF